VSYEIERQAKVLDAGDTVIQETRHWNEEDATTRSMRSKEESSDYRYFPEPDLVPLEITAEWRETIRASLPELPQARRSRLLGSGLNEGAATQIAADARLGDLFDGAVSAGADAKHVANWLTGEVVAFERRSEVGVADTPLTAAHLGELAAMVDDGTVSATAAKEVLIGVLEGEGSPGEVAAGRDLVQVTDESALGDAVATVLAANVDAAAKIAAGDVKPIGFLVGQVMKATGGKADPKRVSELVAEMAKA
jgi:aspartyl-tRNA(Asn)/glutamyl-tRNA(Gln) amidotransferase subunit B